MQVKNQDLSKIEWTDYTFNPWMGCSKVSTGCTNCYAENMMDKRYGKVQWGNQGQRIKTSEANWKKPLKWNRQAEKDGVRRKVFCASLADVFEYKEDQHEEMDEWRHELFRLISKTQHLDWLLLTKRPENIRELTPYMGDWSDYAEQYPNVWLGTSVENQLQSGRIEALTQHSSTVRFLSCEPLLEEIDIENYLKPSHEVKHPVNWVIVGGESGQGARAMRHNWVESLAGQCQRQGTAFFFKQWGEWGLVGSHPDRLSMTKVGKKKAGNSLKVLEFGQVVERQFLEFPNV